MANKNYLDKTGLLYFWNRIKDWISGKHYLSYDSQGLTDAEKTQARTNIGAGTYSKPSTGIPASDLASGVIPSVPSAASTAPLMDGTAAVGTGATWARADHVHPSDTSRAPLASPALTGTPTAPTAAAGTNTTQIATTAFVKGAIEGAGYVSYETTQNLTATQKANARTNIGAGQEPLIVTYTIHNLQGDNAVTCTHTYSNVITALALGKPIEAHLEYNDGTDSGIVGQLTTILLGTSGTILLCVDLGYGITAQLEHGDTSIEYSLLSMNPSVAPFMDGTADIGMEDYGYAYANHVHPSDTSKVDKVEGKGLSTNDYTTTEKNKLAGIADNANNYSLPAATSSVRGGIIVGSNINLGGTNSDVISVSDASSSAKGVVQLSTDISSDASSNIKATTPQAVVNYVSTSVASAFSWGGSTTFANLPSPSASTLNKIYNLSDAFTTSSDFVEGSGKSYPAGTNILGVKVGNDYKYDVTTGFVDLSPYALDAELIAITNSEIEAIVV